MKGAPSVEVRLPASLRTYWEAPERLRIQGSTLAEVLAALEAAHPGLATRILDDQGRVRQHVMLFVNHEAVGPRAPATVALRAGDVIHVVPALSGG